jgi:hypothetical protein
MLVETKMNFGLTLLYGLLAVFLVSAVGTKVAGCYDS